MAAKALYRKTRSGYDEEFKNRRLRSFVVLNKAKQRKEQVTFCFKCEASVSSKTSWKRLLLYLLRKYCVMGQAGSHPMNCTF